LGVTTLKFQKLDDMVAAIGLPREKLCTYCWNGAEPCADCPSKAAVLERPTKL
jgi:glutamine phosphoribosylpyrophosphate amidotransferase